MAAIKINAATSWTAATWVLEALIGRISNQLQPTEREQLCELLEVAEPERLKFVSIEEWPAARLRLLLQRLRAAEDALKREGKDRWGGDPDFYDGFCAQVNRLVTAIENDPRIGAAATVDR